MNNTFSQNQSVPINLPAPVITIPQTTASTYRIIEAVDNHQSKTVTVKVIVGDVPMGMNMRHFVVWSGDAYDAIGQWTDTDLINAVTPMIVNSFTAVS